MDTHFDNHQYTPGNCVEGTFAYSFEVTLRTQSANNMDITTSWLIIEVANLQIPENLLFAVPLVMFMPYLVRWWKRRQMAYSVLLRKNWES